MPSGSVTYGVVGGYNDWSNAIIRNGSGGGTLSLVKTGAGTQVIGTSGMNTYLQHTGTTTVTEGVLNLGIVNRGCSSPIVFNGGTLGHIGGGYLTMSGVATVAANSVLNVSNNGSNNQLFFDAGFAGSADLTVNNSGSATTGVNFRNSAGSGYSGTMTVNGGQIGISGGAGFVLANANLTLVGAAVNLSGEAGGVFACSATNASIRALNGDGASSVVLGGQTLTLGSNNGSGSFAGTVGGSGGLAKTGTGTQTLTGDVTYTGATTVNGGTLSLDYSTVDAGKLSDTSVLTLGGGAVNLAGGTHQEAVLSTTLNAGSSAVTRTSGTAVLQLGAITANAGATINFSADGIATTTSGTAGEMLGTWATVGTGAGTRFATKDASNYIIGLTGTAALTVNDFVDSAANYDYGLSGGTDTLTDNRTANTVRYGGSGETVEMDAYTLTIKTLMNSGTGTLTLASSSGGSLVADNLVLNAVSSGISVPATITGTNLATIGNVTISGDNYYTGNTVISGGTLTAGHEYALGTTTAVAITGGTLDVNGQPLYLRSLAGDSSANVTNSGADTILTTANTSTDNYAGVIHDGSGTISLAKTGGGTQILSGNNTYSGATTISGGTLQIGDGGISGSLGTASVENNATLRFYKAGSHTVANTITGTGNIRIYNAAGGSITFTGPITCNNLNFDRPGSGSSVITLSGSSPNTINSFTSDQDGNGTLVLAKDAGVNALSGTISVGCGGSIGDGYASQVMVKLANNEQIDDASVVRMGGSWGGHGGRAWFDLMGHNETIAGLVDGTSQSYVRNMSATASVLTLAGSGTYSVGGYIHDGGSGRLNIVKSGSGTQTFTGNGIDYNGSTTVNNGRLILSNNDDTWTSMTTVASGAVVEVYRDNGAEYEHRNAFTLNGAGTFEKTGNGTMDMNWDKGGTVAMESGGFIHVKGGTLRLGYGSMSVWTNNKADLTVDAGASFELWDNNNDGVFVDSLNGEGVIIRSNYGQTGYLTVGVDGGSGEFSGAISCGSGNTRVVKTGGGTQVLSGTTDNSSITVAVTGGTLVLAKTAAAQRATAGVADIGAGAILQLAGSNDDQIYGGSGSDPFSLVAMSGGTFDFNGRNEGWDRLTGTGTVSNSAASTTSVMTLGEAGGGSTFDGTITDGAGAMAVTKTGGGTLTLTGTNTYTGVTTVDGGVLAVDGGAINDTNTLLITGGKVAATGTEVVGVLDFGSGPVASGTYGASGSGATHIDDTHFTGTAGVVQVGSGTSFASWMDEFTFAPEADKSATGDPDHDGIPNALEMVLGGNPATGMDSALMPTIELVTNPGGSVPDGDYLLFTYRRADLAVDAGLAIDCETDSDLAGTWTVAQSPAATILVDDDFAWTNPAATDTDRVRVYVPRGANTTLFGRLSVTVP